MVIPPNPEPTAAPTRRPWLIGGGMVAGLIAVVVVVLVVGAPTSAPAGDAGGRAPSSGGTPAAREGTETAAPVATATPGPSPAPGPSSAPGPTQDPPPIAEPPPAPPAPAACSDYLLDCVNLARAENGLPPLAESANLNAVAQACAERMAASGQLTHSASPGGYARWGENIAVGYPSVTAVFDGWMGSSGHRANILDAGYTEMGIGYVAAGNWWCQQFGG